MDGKRRELLDEARGVPLECLRMALANMSRDFLGLPIRDT